MALILREMEETNQGYMVLVLGDSDSTWSG
jgi:hypothetical protein